VRLVVLEELDDVAEVASDEEDVELVVEDEHELGASGMLDVAVSVEAALDATISFEMEVVVVVSVVVFAGCNSGATRRLDEIRTAAMTTAAARRVYRPLLGLERPPIVTCHRDWC
jgi:hypothetical protein